MNVAKLFQNSLQAGPRSSSAFSCSASALPSALPSAQLADAAGADRGADRDDVAPARYAGPAVRHTKSYGILCYPSCLGLRFMSQRSDREASRNGTRGPLSPRWDLFCLALLSVDCIFGCMLFLAAPSYPLVRCHSFSVGRSSMVLWAVCIRFLLLS